MYSGLSYKVCAIVLSLYDFYVYNLIKVLYNFYQSEPWKYIQKYVYNKPCFDIEIFGKKYLGVIKEKEIAGMFSTKRFQILGLELPMGDEKLIKKELGAIKKKYQKQYGNIYFQFGILNEIFRFDIYPLLNQDCVDNIIEIRKGVEKILYNDFGLQRSFVENMPLANVIYPVPKQENFLDQIPSKSTRKVIRKAIQGGFEFRPISDDEIDVFWEYWTEVADMKRFFTVNKEQYLKLVNYLRTEKTGNLFVSTLGGEIMSGGIYIFDGSVITYLYGFIRRTEKNIGGQHFLTYAMLQRAKKNGYYLVNAMGVAPTGIKNHPLASVGRVKELLGGYKIEHYGNFDLIFNKLLYKLYQRLRR